jgi:hypothetical protein
MTDAIERAAARPEPACAPVCANTCPHTLAQCLLARATARRRHDLIVFGEDLALHLAPAVVMTGVVAALAPKAALAAGAAYVLAQQGAAALVGRLRPRLPDAIDGALEVLPLALGATIATAASIALGTASPLLGPTTAITGLALLFWPALFHRLRATRCTDFELMTTLEAGCGCARI